MFESAWNPLPNFDDDIGYSRRIPLEPTIIAFCVYVSAIMRKPSSGRPISHAVENSNAASFSMVDLSSDVGAAAGAGVRVCSFMADDSVAAGESFEHPERVG